MMTTRMIMTMIMMTTRMIMTMIIMAMEMIMTMIMMAMVMVKGTPRNNSVTLSTSSGLST